jgi:hypothetical protein
MRRIISPFPMFFRQPSFSFEVTPVGSISGDTDPSNFYKVKLPIPRRTFDFLICTYDFTVDWGDGSSIAQIISWDDTDGTHTYADATPRIITIKGECSALAFGRVWQTGISYVVGDIVIQAGLNASSPVRYICKLAHVAGTSSQPPTGGSWTTYWDYDYMAQRTVLSLTGIGNFIGDMGFTCVNFRDCVNLFEINSSISNLKSLTTCIAFFMGTSISSIPSGIFDNSLGITSFQAICHFCTNLTSVPTDLFRYNTAATIFSAAFNGCSNLLTVPTDLFRYNINATTFQDIFKGCIKLQLNANIFYGDGEQGTRFLNKTVNFIYCFNRTSFSGTQGIAPDLWNCDFGLGTPTRTGCYGGAGNSLTSLSNYNDIPTNWKIY